jgi:hypothetical protein
MTISSPTPSIASAAAVVSSPTPHSSPLLTQPRLYGLT